MSAENPNPVYPEQSSFMQRHWRTGVAVMAGMAIMHGGARAYEYLQSDGEATSIEARNPLPGQPDRFLRIGSWNMYNETAGRFDEIRVLAHQNKLDILNLQEVNTKDVERLSEAFPRWNIESVLADTKQEISNGGYQNVIMSRYKMKDVEMLQMKGDSLAETGRKTLVAGTLDALTLSTSLGRTHEALLENRAAIAVTIPVHDGQGLRDVRVINTHIDGRKVLNQRHMKQLLRFAQKNTVDNRPTVLCGDLNAGRNSVIPAFAEIGFITPETGPTSTNNEETLDYCAYDDQGALALGDVRVVKKIRTDHYAIVGSWSVRLAKRENGL